MAAAADDDGTGDMNTSLRRVHIGYDSDVDDGGIAPPPFRRLGIFFVRVIFLRLWSGGRGDFFGKEK